MSVRVLPPALATKALKELNEDPSRLMDDLQHMKDWIAKQPHLRARTDDQWIVAFLRGCKYSLEKTKEKIDLFYSLRTTAPELYTLKHTEPLFNEIMDTGCLLILPKTASPDAPRVTLFRPGKYDHDRIDVLDMISVTSIIQSILFLEDDHFSVAGNLIIVDLEGVNVGHFVQMTPAIIKKIAVVGQDASPLRMKGAHYINTPPVFEFFFNTIKAFFNEKYRNRAHVHNRNYEELYKYIPKDILPVEYGGNGGTTEELIEYFKNKVKEFGTILDQDLQFGTDESKRPGKPRTAEDMFGAEGSFRKLEVD